MASTIVLFALIALSYGYTIRENPRRYDERITYYENKYPERQYHADSDSHYPEPRRFNDERYYLNREEAPFLAPEDSDYQYQRRKSNDYDYDYQTFNNKKEFEDWFYKSNAQDHYYPFKTISDEDLKSEEMNGNDETARQEKITSLDEIENIQSDATKVEEKDQEEKKDEKVITKDDAKEDEVVITKSNLEDEKQKAKDEKIEVQSKPEDETEKEKDEIKEVKIEATKKDEIKEVKTEAIKKDEKIIKEETTSTKEMKDASKKDPEKDEKIKEDAEPEKLLLGKEDRVEKDEKAPLKEEKLSDSIKAKEETSEDAPKYKYDNLFKDESVDISPKVNKEKKDEKEEIANDVKTEDEELIEIRPIQKELIRNDKDLEDTESVDVAATKDNLEEIDNVQEDKTEDSIPLQNQKIEKDPFSQMNFKENLREESNDYRNRYDIPEQPYMSREFDEHREPYIQPFPRYRQYDAPIYERYYRPESKRSFPMRFERREDYERPIIRRRNDRRYQRYESVAI